MEGKITKPLRHNGVPYSGINILMLWGASIEAGYLSPYWMPAHGLQQFAFPLTERGSRINILPAPVRRRPHPCWT